MDRGPLVPLVALSWLCVVKAAMEKKVHEALDVRVG